MSREHSRHSVWRTPPADRRSTEQPQRRATHEQAIDEAIDMTFPASDPPAVGGTTKIGKRDDVPGNRRGH